MKYWIGVVSADHVKIGVAESMAQLGHGKRGPLARLKKNDWIIYYSPVKTYGDKQPLQAFTALGQIADDEIYEYPISDSFVPFRRRVNYLPVKEMPIRPLLNQLELTRLRQSWGYVFRFGLVEIPESDFNLIKQSMIV